MTDAVTDAQVAVSAGGTHFPGPFPDEAPYTRHCVDCSLPWPCPDRLASIEVPLATTRRHLESGEEAILARVGKWWHVEGRDGMAEFARTGGTVVGYHDEEDLSAPQEPARVFHVLCWHRRVPHLISLARADVEPAGCREPDTSMLRSHSLELLRVVGEGGTDKARLRWLRLATECMERVVS